MLSLHQLRCFLATYEHGSLTAAADELGYAQPSVSEQVRALEKSLGVPLFRRVGRGVAYRPRWPTRCARTPSRPSPRPRRRGARCRARWPLESGNHPVRHVRCARLYAGAQIVADVLERYPGVRVELIGQHSNEVQEQLRRGHLEAAMIAVTSVESEGMTVIPVARDELVYIGRPRVAPPHRDRGAARKGVADHAGDDVAVQLLLSRSVLRRFLHEAGHNPKTRIEVEEVETAVHLVGRGLGDSVIPRGGAEQLIPAGAARRLRFAAPQAVRRDGDRAPNGRGAVTRGSGDDRAGYEAHPVDHGAGLEQVAKSTRPRISDPGPVTRARGGLNRHVETPRPTMQKPSP